MPHRRKPGKAVTPEQRSVNQVHSRLRWPVERTIARVETWRTFPRPGSAPTITRAILAREAYRRNGPADVAGPAPDRRAAALLRCACAGRGRAVTPGSFTSLMSRP
ncbi:hypothetical protein ACFXPT_31435 [Streptomyces goshikiensis]|uniref:hypothetical protein n=1 Tax=Streptomyces goshikiensis TaxID=1942 RepID=UPI0036B08711